MKRETGHYWVKFEGDWHVAYFEEDGTWRCIDTDDVFFDDDFELIHETQIKHP